MSRTGFFEHGNDALQVVSFFAAYSEFLALDSRLNLDLCFLDHFHELRARSDSMPCCTTTFMTAAF